MKSTILTWDIETWGIEEKWRLPPETMFRLGGYAWGDGPVQITTSLNEMRSVIREAEYVIGHNIHQFDLTVLFGKDSTEPLDLALANRVYDTWSDAPVVLPYPESYEHYTGVIKGVNGPASAKSFYSLNNLAFQLGTVPKVNSISDLAKKWGGFEKIPLDDKDYNEYLIGDVEASRELAALMMSRWPWSEYRARNQRVHGILAQISRNGFEIDVTQATSRIKTLNDQKDLHLGQLQRDYGLPTTGKAPLRTKVGKAAVLAALASVGVSEDELPLTPTGAPKLGGKDILEAVKGKGDAAELLANSLAIISGTRMTAETLLRNRQPDGRAHPEITALQRSGRLSFTEPGLTVIGSRGDGANDKKIIVAKEGHLLVELDFSGADTRAVCAYSGDEDFYRDYVLGDPHTTSAKLIWPDDELLPGGKHPQRQRAKPVTHGSAYRIGATKLAKMTGITLFEAENFLRALERNYAKRTAWQNRVTGTGKWTGHVVSHWGRELPVDVGRAYTQSCAQLGQNATLEIMCDGLLSLPVRLIERCVGLIHDAALFELAEETVQEDVALIKAAFERTFHPVDGIPVTFELEAGTPGHSWFDGSH